MIKVGKNKVDMYRGFWTPNTYYDVDDMVFQDGQLWVANANFSSTGVFEPLNWMPLCCGGGDIILEDKYRGAWEPSTEYDEYDVVFHNGALWITTSSFTSSGTFDENNWICHSCPDPSYPYPVNIEQGFDLTRGTPNGYTYVGGDTSIIENTSGSIQHYSTAYGAMGHSTSDYLLRYFEYEVLAGSPYGGCGTSASAAWVGNDKSGNSIGYRSDTGDVYREKIVIGSGNPVPVGGFIRFWTRRTRIWIGSYSSLYGYEIVGGGDPYINYAPTDSNVPMGVPLASCYNPGDRVRLNTVGNFAHPPLPNARPWDS